MKKALIFGITGQTGSYLAEHLLQLGYDVHGVIRRSSTFNTSRLSVVFDKIRDNLHYGDILDPLFVVSIVKEVNPTEIYNLAAQSHVAVSFKLPLYTTNVDAAGVVNVLEAIRISDSKAKLYQAGTSEMFGGHSEDYDPEVWDLILQNGMDHTTVMNPKSPYGVAKLFAHHMVKVYRNSYGIFASNGICFNHESERRDPRFVTRKVTRTVARISLGKEDHLVLGNLDAKRDWGHARNYASAIHLILQYDKPLDIVIATGNVFSVRDLVETAFEAIGKEIIWSNSGIDEIGVDKSSGKKLVSVSEKFYRPNEVPYLKGNPDKAKKVLNWSSSTSFKDMITKMVKNDILEQSSEST